MKKKIRKMLALLFALVLVVGCLPMAASASFGNVWASGFNGVKAAGLTCHGWENNYLNSYWGQEAGHNCTNYVAYMLSNKRVGNFLGQGNANMWKSWAQNAGYGVDNTPAVGAIAWWGNSAGHVAYVEEINWEQEYIVVSEDNWGGDYDWSFLGFHDGGWPQAFLHIKDGGTANPKPEFTFTEEGASAIKHTSAHIHAKLNNWWGGNRSKMTETGYRLWNSFGELAAVHTRKITGEESTWWCTYLDQDQNLLIPGEKYTCEAYGIVNGYDFYSSKFTFTTGKADIGSDFYARISIAGGFYITEGENGSVTIQKPTNGTNQIWHFVKLADGSYNIYSTQNAKKVLDVDGAGTQSGTKIITYNKWGTNGNPAQEWVLGVQSSGYVLRSKCAGKVLDVLNGSNPKAGARVQLYDSNGSKAQEFKVEKTKKPQQEEVPSTEEKDPSIEGGTGDPDLDPPAIQLPNRPIVAGFSDVFENAYYGKAVKWAVDNSITSGIDNTHFGPNTACTRAQAVTFLWRAAGTPEPQNTDAGFTDVKAGDYYEKAVRWAVENGVTSGTGDGKFSPNSTCTRAQIVTFQYRAAGSPSVGAADSFGDVNSGAYYADAVAWAVQNDITSGTGEGKFSPNNTCTRAQIVSFLYRYAG